jgi:hypothetical protein
MYVSILDAVLVRESEFGSKHRSETCLSSFIFLKLRTRLDGLYVEAKEGSLHATIHTDCMMYSFCERSRDVAD